MRTGKKQRWVVLVPAILALAVATVPLAPAPGPAGAADDSRTEATGMVAEAMQMDRMFVQLWNERKFDELGQAYYVEDAILVPPNHEPIRGRAAILEYFRGSRDALGDIELNPNAHRASASGNLVSLVPGYTAHGGKVPAAAHELFERQPDGSLKCTVDMFGFGDPLA